MPLALAVYSEFHPKYRNLKEQVRRADPKKKILFLPRESKISHTLLKKQFRRLNGEEFFLFEKDFVHCDEDGCDRVWGVLGRPKGIFGLFGLGRFFEGFGGRKKRNKGRRNAKATTRATKRFLSEFFFM